MKPAGQLPLLSAPLENVAVCFLGLPDKVCYLPGILREKPNVVPLADDDKGYLREFAGNVPPLPYQFDTR